MLKQSYPTKKKKKKKEREKASRIASSREAI
jgi:hypothetical protein